MKPILAENYEGQDPTGWLMSEKLDGVRAIWNGSKLMSRNGNPFSAPKWVADKLTPNECLDGELYLGRGRFQETVSIVKKKRPIDAEWEKLTFCVFDAPEAGGGFENRIAHCKELLEGGEFASVVFHRRCTGQDDLEGFLSWVIEQGGEGVMLRASRSLYEYGRSSDLLKYKQKQSNEAVLLGFELGNGRLAGITGALVVRWEGVTFRIGSGLSDSVRKSPPEIGSSISFGYCGLTDSGCPRFPTFQAVRDYE